MEIAYQLTEKDFRDAIVAHRHRTAFAMWWFRIMLLGAVIAGAAGVLLLVVETSSELRLNAAILVAVAVFWAGCKWAGPWWAARRQYRQQPSAQGPRTVMLDSTGMHWRWDGGTADIDWKNITRFLETKNEFLLYASPAAFNMVPKRALSPEQVTELRALLSEHVSSSRK